MDVIVDGGAGDVRLTTESPASRHGFPVLHIDGDFGPEEMVGNTRAVAIVTQWLEARDRTPDELDAARLFLAPAAVFADVGDVARLADLSDQAVLTLIQTDGDFPKPIGRTSAGSIYLRAEVEGWLRSAGRLPPSL